MHARRATLLRERGARRPASRADTEFFMWLTAAASLGDAIFGPLIERWLGRDAPAAARKGFRARFGRLLFEQLHGDASARER